MKNFRSKIFVAGHKGMLGSSILRKLKKKGYKNLITVEKKKLDLRSQKSVEKFFRTKKPEVVIIAAAKVGGIKANINYPANFINDNLQIQTNLISSSFKNKIKKLILFGSSCIYPKNLKRPIKEKDFMTGSLEKTNESYAIAKIAGIQMIKSYNRQHKTNYICLMPCNLFGPNDNYDLQNSHFLPALIKKIYLASKKKNNKIVNLWGTGKPLREILYVDEVAEACEFFLRKKTKHTLINIGSGIEKTIEGFAKFLMKKFQIKLKIKKDFSKPNGTPRKILNSKIAKNYGWKSKIDLGTGLNLTYKDFLEKNKT